MKKVVQINEDIAIWSDSKQYILRIRGQHSRYFPELENCFQDMFDYICKKKLSEGKTKTMEQTVKIIKDTKKEIKDIIKPFTKL